MNPIRTFEHRAVFIAVLAALFCAAANGSHAAGDKTELYAVVVGVSKYQDKNIPELNMAHKDAADFHNFLKERAGLFAKAHIHPLLTNENATRSNVVKALREFLRPAGKDDIVIIYVSGHGAADPATADEFYFCTYDSHWDNLYGTALLMTDSNLFRHIDSEKVLLIADACHSGGFVTGMQQQARAKSVNRFANMFNNLKGRVALLSSKPDQSSFETPRYGNSVFTHFLLKGLRGDARTKGGDFITTKEIYEYVYQNTKTATDGMQAPQMFPTSAATDSTAVFKSTTFQDTLDMKVQFFYEGSDARVRPLNEGDTLVSRQKVGVSFQTQTDCYVYIFWWDSNGQVGQLYPNPELTEGSGEVKAGKAVWLPSRSGDRWYVLDDSPGAETIYFVASRQKNPQIEALARQLAGQAVATNSGAVNGSGNKSIGAKIEHTINLMSSVKPIKTMGFQNRTAAKDAAPTSGGPAVDESYSDKYALFKSVENDLQVSGSDAMFKLTFTHK